MGYKGKTNHLVNLYMQVWLYQFLGIFILAVARFIHFMRFNSLESIFNYLDCFPMYLWNSWRFDIQAITYIALPAIVGTIAVSFCPERVVARFKRIMRNYFVIMLTVLTAIVVAEFFFYDNFQARYNVVFFDFFDEGPWGLLQTMWQDYPFVGILLFVFGVGVLVYYISRFILKFPGKGIGVTKGTAIVVSLCIVALTFVLMRGSVTRYLLQVEAFMVSPDETINKSVPNAIYLLKKAYKERSKSFQLYSDEELLSQHGFSSLDEAISAARLPLLEQGNNHEKVKAALFNIINEERDSLVERPNVVLILNESWSQYLLQMDKGEQLDLIGSLRSHLQEDLLFKNIQSVRNGTIYSLETVTLAMPYMKFFHSRYRFQHLESSIAYPFKENGYHTAFVTGMDPTWENVQEGLAYQGFDAVIGRQDILHEIEGSTTSAIGVYDEFLMEYLHNYMDKLNKEGSPFFILVLTTTNHPPFTFPDNLQLPELTEGWYKSPCLNGDDETLRKYGVGFQYANEALGDFLTEFKKKEVSNNTLVMVTGDHNVRSIIDYQRVPSQYMYAVPMYLYLPQPYYKLDQELKGRVEERYGSHYDILPTLAPLCFEKGTRYMDIGQNLLDSTKNNRDYYSYNEKQLLLPNDTEQDADSIMEMIKVRELICKIYCQQQFRKLKEK